MWRGPWGYQYQIDSEKNKSTLTAKGLVIRSGPGKLRVPQSFRTLSCRIAGRSRHVHQLVGSTASGSRA